MKAIANIIDGIARLRRHVGSLPAWMLLSLALLWLELVFKASTLGDFIPSIVPITLFSVTAGIFLDLLTSLSSRPQVNRLMRLLTLLAICVLFGIEYFVFCEFKVLYDPVTVLSGASQATRSFSDQIFVLLFNASGLAHIALFLLPALLYAVVMPYDRAQRIDFKRAWRLVGIAVATHLCTLTLITLLGNFGLVYTSRYSFEAGVRNFGYLTSLRLNIQRQLASPDISQRLQVNPSDNDPSQEAKETTAKKYDPSTLDIDFSALPSDGNETWAALDAYVSAQEPSRKNEMTGLFKGYNLIFISAEAFCSEAIRQDITPTLYRMATKGIQFSDYYQPASAGTTGGEYLNLFGMLPTDGGASFTDTTEHNKYLTMGFMLNRLGYEGWAFHNNDYTYYDRNITHNALGYNNGFMGMGNGMEQWVEQQWPESDLEMLQGTWSNLYGKLGDAKHPFNVYYMSVSGHGIYGLDMNDMSRKHWNEVKDLPYSDDVKAYLAANIELDKALEYLIKQLEKRKISNRTVIVVAADHFPYGLDGDSPDSLPLLSELYGHEVSSILDRDHNRLIIWSGSLEKRKKPIVVDTPCSSMDILPTLLNLFGTEWDSRLLPGRDVFSDRAPLVFDLSYDWKTDLGCYINATDTFTPAQDAQIPDGYVEAIHEQVAQKIDYSSAVLESDYFRHVFGEPEDTFTANLTAKLNQTGKELDPWELADELIRNYAERHRR